MSDPILFERRDDVVILTLNAPRLRNAISVAMRERLLDHLRDAQDDRSCRSIVLTGAGGHFCSGGQLQTNGAALPPDPERTRRNVGVLQDIVRILVAGAKPVVAGVEGYAFGAGLSFAAACDLVVAGEGAKFCASFGKVGLMADAGLMWSLPQRVGRARARDMMLTARPVLSAEAAAIGLADRVTPDGEVLAEAIAVARGFSAIAPLAVQSMKAILACGPSSLEAVLALESDAQPRLAGSADYVEGRAAFNERRAPVFKGL